MKQMTWGEFYEGFYEWSYSTQKSYTYRLSDYGPAEQVWEVAEELAFQDEAFITRFLGNAFTAGVRFTPAQVLEMIGIVQEQLEEIYLMIDDESFQRISARAAIDVFDDVSGADFPAKDAISAPPRKRKGGLFSTLAAMAFGSALVDRTKKEHPGHYNGDCTKCPPHYSYRHGRWYYGKGHQYGCEFGGNKGAGGV